MSIIDNLKLTFKNGNSLIKLIYLNVTVFLLVNILLIVFRLFNADASEYIH